MNKQKHLSIKYSHVSADWVMGQWWCFTHLWLSASSPVTSNAEAQTEFRCGFHWRPWLDLAPGCKGTTETPECTVIGRRDIRWDARLFKQTWLLSWDSPVSGKLTEVYVWFKYPLSLVIVPVRLKRSIKVIDWLCAQSCLRLKNCSPVSERKWVENHSRSGVVKLQLFCSSQKKSMDNEGSFLSHLCDPGLSGLLLARCWELQGISVCGCDLLRVQTPGV